MRTLIITLALAITSIATAQENQSNWWESYNSKNSETAVRNKPDWSYSAYKIQACLNVDWMNGEASKGFEGSVGYGIGFSMDALNNTNIGLELGTYLSRSRLTLGIGDDYNTNINLNYLEIQLMADPRLFLSDSSIELNLGLAYNIGLWGSMSYKSENLNIDPFSEKSGGGKALLKNQHFSLLYGLTFRWEHAYIRMLMHQGLSNIANTGTEKATLWNCDFSLGYIF